MSFRLSPIKRPLPKRRWLDFDIEARPLSWIGGDFVSREITAICARFIDQRRYYVWALEYNSTDDDIKAGLEGFRELYDQADVVTGHFIRNYDLPNINGAMVEYGLPPLAPKLSQCTKNDLTKLQGVSKSQESLGQILGTKAPKVHMGQQDWREANRLSPEGVAKTIRRVKGDVRQHIEMLAILRKRGLLSPPKMWYPNSGTTKTVYVP